MGLSRLPATRYDQQASYAASKAASPSSAEPVRHFSFILLYLTGLLALTMVSRYVVVWSMCWLLSFSSPEGIWVLLTKYLALRCSLDFTLLQASFLQLHKLFSGTFSAIYSKGLVRK